MSLYTAFIQFLSLYDYSFYTVYVLGMPIANFVMLPTMDIAVHKWDLSKGTSQTLAMDAGLAEVDVSVLDIGGELGRQFR